MSTLPQYAGSRGAVVAELSLSLPELSFSLPELSLSLLLVGTIAVVSAMRRNSNPATLWTMGWIVFGAMAAFIRAAADAPWSPIASPLLSATLPAFILAGALCYCDRPVPPWLLPAGLGVGLLRWGLLQLGAPQASHAIAIGLEPAITLAAAWLVMPVARKPGSTLAQRLLAPSLLCVAALDAATGVAVATDAVGGGGLSAGWASVFVLTLPLQITAAGHRSRRLRHRLQTESALARRALEESRQRFDTLAEHASDLIAEIDAQGNISYLSPSLREVLGREPSDLLGSSAVALIHPEDRAAAENHLRSALDDDASGEFVFRFPHSDGSWRWMESSFRSFRGSEGEVRVVAVSRDITTRRQTRKQLERSHQDLEQRVAERTAQLRTAVEELEGEVLARREAERELHSSRERYRLVSELSSDYSFSFKMSEQRPFQCEWVTDAFSKLTGYQVDELDAEDWRRMLAPDHLVAVESELEDEGTGEVFEVEGALTTKWGNQLWLRTRISLLPIDDAGGFRIVGASRDISDRKRAEQERRKLESQLSEVQRRESLGVLAGGVAHDFNNLLSVVLGNAELGLREVPEDSTLGSRLVHIRSAALHGAALTEQMLTYSGKTPYSPLPSDLSTIVEDTRDLLEASMGVHGVLELQLGSNLPPVDGDETQLRQVVINLVANAAEALGDNGGHVRVRTELRQITESELTDSIGFSAARAGKFLVLEVEDSGRGISEHTRKRVFDPFFTTRDSGRGLGLAAVLGIVRGHEGIITVESEPGSGTRFRVCIPPSQEPLSAQPEQVRQHIQARPQCASVLVVDDEEAVLEVGAEFLKQAGFEVLTASGGREAVAILTAQRDLIAAVVLDLVMPGMGGEETFRELRRVLPGVPVILSSGYDEGRVSQRFTAGDITSFIRKPYRSVELIDKVRAATEVRN